MWKRQEVQEMSWRCLISNFRKHKDVTESTLTQRPWNQEEKYLLYESTSVLAAIFQLNFAA